MGLREGRKRWDEGESSRDETLLTSRNYGYHCVQSRLAKFGEVLGLISQLFFFL